MFKIMIVCFNLVKWGMMMPKQCGKAVIASSFPLAHSIPNTETNENASCLKENFLQSKFTCSNKRECKRNARYFHGCSSRCQMI